MSAHGLDKIPDSLGFMVLNEDGGILSSGGDLDGQDRIAGIMTSMLRCLSRLRKDDGSPQSFQRVTLVLDAFFYGVTVSNQKIFVVKRSKKPAVPAKRDDFEDDDEFRRN